jgi:hypothetical protein
VNSEEGDDNFDSGNEDDFEDDDEEEEETVDDNVFNWHESILIRWRPRVSLMGRMLTANPMMTTVQTTWWGMIA